MSDELEEFDGHAGAPRRHDIPWREADWYDEAALDVEMRRVFDICHGCRRCFNLCDSFPKLFDLIDAGATGELDSIASEDFKPVVDACTLCDMCFMVKCPYVPPHEFNLDFPHLMLRYRAVEKRRGQVGFVRRQLAKTDRNGKLAAPLAGLTNWATRQDNHGCRKMLQELAGIHKDAALPQYQTKSFTHLAKKSTPEVNTQAPGFGRKAVIYATCIANYNNPEIGLAARAVLARNGVRTEVVYPQCCGMPLLEQGDLAAVASNARKVAAVLQPWLDKGYDVIALVPSCALMLKFEWPLIEPNDSAIGQLSARTFDITEYVADIAKKHGLAPGLAAIPGGITLHFACHARAQNMGAKGAEMLRLIPDTKVDVVERCSGHGGAWGIMVENFETALKVGRPAARAALKGNRAYVVSECPLAGEHLRQGMERLAPVADGEAAPTPKTVAHPILLLAQSYGLLS